MCVSCLLYGILLLFVTLLSVNSFLMAWLLYRYSYVLHLSKVLLNANFLKSASSYLCSILSAGRPPKWVLQKGAAESHVDADPQGAAESRVDPDLSGQGTAESRRGVEPAPVPTNESNGDPVEVPAESRSEPGTVTGASNCEPVLVDESTEEPTSFSV